MDNRQFMKRTFLIE